jgi:hypothetical protein
MVICKSYWLEQVFHEKHVVPQLDKRDAAFYGPEDSWTCIRAFHLSLFTAGPIHPTPITFFWMFIVILSFHWCPGFTDGSFSQASQLEPCMHVSSFLCYLVPCSSRYFPQHPILRTSSPCVPIPNDRKNYTSLYSMFVLWGSKWKDSRFWTKWWGMHLLNSVCS